MPLVNLGKADVLRGAGSSAVDDDVVCFIPFQLLLLAALGVGLGRLLGFDLLKDVAEGVEDAAKDDSNADNRCKRFHMILQ